MRLARIGEPGREIPVACDTGDRWLDLRTVVDDIGPEALGDGLADIAAAVREQDLPEVSPGRFGPPLSSVGKIVCIGLNYSDHAAETGAEVPAEPVVFLKAIDTLVGPDDAVSIPRLSTHTDWEVELAVVIGRTARYLGSDQDASACIAGYAISHDVSEREFQLHRGGQWDKGKSCETFNPFGPWILTADQVADPQDLSLQLSVNGVLRQDGHTADMIFGVRHLVWYLSQFMVLRPGDIINTGTPAGVALGRPDTPYLRAGDQVRLSIDGLGTQHQRFVAAS
jgi:2-keto-4-pentenoate hydratase/2-oxohepta-3-ene-1,7-dioic acid hydratase in catechol pathway